MLFVAVYLLIVVLIREVLRQARHRRSAVVGPPCMYVVDYKVPLSVVRELRAFTVGVVVQS